MKSYAVVLGIRAETDTDAEEQIIDASEQSQINLEFIDAQEVKEDVKKNELLLLTKSSLKALKTVVEYAYANEENHYLEDEKENRSKGHVYHSLRLLLKKMLENNIVNTKDYFPCAHCNSPKCVHPSNNICVKCGKGECEE